MDVLAKLYGHLKRTIALFGLWVLLTVAAMSLMPGAAALALLAATALTLVVGRLMRQAELAPAPVCEGIEVSRSRLATLLARFKPTIALGKGPVTPGRVARALSKPEVMNKIRNFQAHHMHDLIEEISDGKLDWNNESCELFFELMRKRHKLRSGLVIAGLLYVMEERDFALRRDTLSHLRGVDLATFAQEAARSDVLCEMEFDRVALTRVARDCGLKLSEGRLERAYSKARRSLQMSKFEDNLLSGASNGASIVHQIREDADRAHREAIRAEVDASISEHLSLDLDDYIIVGPDYSRDSRIDAYYRKHFSYVLSRAFDGHCCSCGEGMGALQFDHFWCPKSSGGNFLMRSRDGVYVNNCIPLCGSCNASKGKRDFCDVFSPDQVEDIVRRSQGINAFVNEHMIDFLDPEFVGRVGCDEPIALGSSSRTALSSVGATSALMGG